MKSYGLLAAFASITILGIAVGCSQPASSLSGDDDSTGDDTKSDDVTTSKAPATKSSTTATTPPAATTAAPTATTTPDAGPPATTGNSCQDLSTCCATVSNPIAKFACDAASQAGDEDTCAEVLQGCQLAKNLPNGN